MMNRLLKKSKAGTLFLYLMGVIIITMSAYDARAQITIDFNGAFPPPGPPVVSNPIGTGASDAPGLVKWYRGDTSVVIDFGNAGINPGRGGSGFAACFNSYDIQNNGKADLIINDVNLSTGYAPAAVLKFWMLNVSGTDVIRVFARNGSDPWVQVGASTYGVSATWTQYSVSLQAFTGGANTTVDIRLEATSDYGADNIGIDDITITQPDPMTYVSSTSFQRLNDREIFKPLPNQEILRMVINTTGLLTPLVPNTMYLSTTGTQNAANNIENAKLWYTGAVATFDPKTATPVGTPIASPSGAMTFSGITQALADGANYFFLTYDIKGTANLNDTADATFDSVKIGTTNYYPTLAAPVGRRIIRPATAFYKNPGLGTSTLGRAPSTGSRYNRSISIYPPTEYPDLKAGTDITTVGFEISALGANQATVSGNIKIYMVNTTDASYLKSTTFATAIVGMKKVYDGPLTINPEVGTYDIRLDSAFTYTGGNFYFAFDWEIVGNTSVNATYYCNNAAVGGTSGNRSATSTTAAPTTVSTSAFRPSVKFGSIAPANDIGISNVYTLTAMANPAGNPHQVQALIRNNGFAPVTNYNVNLSVSGANTFNNTKQVSLAFGESTLITFDPYSNTTNGSNTVKVKVATDNNTSNDSLQITQEVSALKYSYSDNSASTNALGYNTGAGYLGNRYYATGAWLVDSVKIRIANNAASSGKKVFAVVINSDGNIISRSDSVTLQAGDLNTLKTFPITAPKVVKDENFFVMLHQTASTPGYFPMATQTESPGRPNAFYTGTQPNTIAPFTNVGRFVVEAFVSPATNGPSVSLGNDVTICQGDSVTLNAGGTGLTYLWSTGATTQSIVVKTPGTYFVTVRNAQGFPARDTVNVTVNQFVAASVEIAQSPTGVVCAGLPVTFTATPTNGGTAPTYVWLKNGTVIPGETGATYTTSTLVNNDAISVIMTSNLLCKSGSPDTSNVISVQVAAGAAPVSVTAAPVNAGPYCAGTSVAFAATPSNGGANPKYKWYINNTLSPNDTLSTFNASGLNNNDTVKVELLSNSLCILGSNTATFKYGVTISPNLPVSVNIAANKDSICQSQTITFTATPTNGGTTPAYKWYRNGVLITGETAATFTTSLVENGDTITCELTSSEICQSGGPAMSNMVMVKVNPLPNSNFTSATQQRAAVFTNTTTDGLTYAWDFGDGATSTDPNPTHTYNADGSFTVRLISSNTCGSDTVIKPVTIATLDANVTGITAPTSNCNLTATTQVRIRVRNNRTSALTNVPVAYQINGGAIVRDTIATIAGSGLSIYTFKTTADLSADGAYNIIGWAAIPNDFDNSNDTFKVAVFNQFAPNAAFTASVTGGDLTTNNATDEGLAATTYAWSFGDGNTSGDKNPTHTYAAPGTYTVKLIATNACGVDSSESTVTVTAVGINNTVNAKNVMVYPNPNSGKFDVDFQLSMNDNVSLKVVNMNGQVVYSNDLGNTSSEKLSIDISDLAAGVYTLKIEGTNTQITKRISLVK